MPEFVNQLASAIGQALSGFVDQLGHDGATVLLAGVLVLAGLCAIAAVAMETADRIRQIREATVVVERSRDAVAFARNFGDVSTRIEALRSLQRSWVRFKSVLVFSRPTGSGKAELQCVGAPADYFSVAGVNEGARDFRALPSAFLSVTLLLTVIGVASSLSGAIKVVDGGRSVVVAEQAKQGAVDAGQIGIADGQGATASSAQGATVGSGGRGHIAATEPTQSALRQLLDAGRASFSVAVAGLLISLLLTAMLRISSSLVDSALRSFTAAVECRVERISFEAIVLERLEGVLSRTGSPADHAISESLKLAIEQAMPVHIETAMGKLRSTIEQKSLVDADANRASLHCLADEFGKLIDSRVANPVRDMTDQMQEQMLRVRGHLVGLADVVYNNGGASSPDGRTNTSSTFVGQPQLGLSAVLQAVEQSQAKISASSRTAISDLGNQVSSRIDREVSTPLRDIALSMVDLRAEVAAVQASIAAPLQADGVPHSATPQPDVRLVAEIVERIKTEVSPPMWGMSEALAEVNAKLGAGITAPVGLGAGTDTSEGSFVWAERLSAEVAALRQSVETGNERVVHDNRFAIRDLMESLISQLGTSAQSHPDLTEVITRIEAKLGHLDATLATTITSTVERPAGSEHDAQLQVLSSNLIAAINSGNDRVADQNLATVNALAEYLTQRLEDNVTNPMLGLTAAVRNASQSIESIQVEAAHSGSQLVDWVGQVTEEMRVATSELREMTTGSMIRSQSEPLADREARLDLLQESIRDLATVANRLEENGSFVAGRLEQAIAASSNLSSQDFGPIERNVVVSDEIFACLAEDVALRFEARIAGPIEGLMATVADIDQRLSAAQPQTIQLEGNLAGEVGEAANDVRLATDDMRVAIATLTAQAQADFDDARQKLIETIVEATRNWDQSGSVVADRLKQLLEGAPAGWSREAEAAARTVHTAAEAARVRLEETVSDLAHAAKRETVEATAALTKISEQLVRQSTHARDAIGTQLASSVSGIEQASRNISDTIAGLTANLSEGARAATAGAMEDLARASSTLRAITSEANADIAQSAAGIRQATTDARFRLATDLEQHRLEIRCQVEEVNAAAADRLEETATGVAVKMANYGGNLSTTADSLVQTLQALSEEMRLLKATIAHRDESELEPEDSAKLAVNDRLLAAYRWPSSKALPNSGGRFDQIQRQADWSSDQHQPHPAATDDQAVAVAFDTFVANKRGFPRAVEG